MSACSHEGYHSGQGRYSQDTGWLHYVVVCDDCLEVVREVEAQQYRPNPDPHGNDRYLRAG